jgi:hypothetical protein
MYSYCHKRKQKRWRRKLGIFKKSNIKRFEVKKTYLGRAVQKGGGGNTKNSKRNSTNIFRRRLLNL